MDLLLASADPPIRYAGELELGDAQYAISVVVDADEGAADGLASSASAPELPEDVRGPLERLAASMARKAVRGARKDGLRPPRRIRRWRSVQA
jgi:hypothetical protein